MLIFNSLTNITVNSETFSFYYSYGKDSTFQGLFEHFALLCPSLNICPCYHFKFFFNGQYGNISKAYKILQFKNVLNNLTLFKIEDICPHNNSNYLLLSKLDLFNEYQKMKEQFQIENGNKNMIINDLNKEKERLIQVIKSTKKKIEIIKDLPIENKNLKANGNDFIIDEKSNELLVKENIIKPQFTDFYDVIAHIDSIKDITKGWRIDMNKKGEENYKKYKDQNLLKIGVIGNANKGKSFLLSKISKMKLPSGMNIKTEGLSIKYPDLSLFKDRKIALLDSAGLETPVLLTGEEIDNNKNSGIFKEKSREKLITELFLQNYIINNSDILIVVVDSLSFSEQKLLLKVKREMERSNITIPLYIIHNLKSFTSKEQVKDYIENTLLKSATFTLEKGNNISTKLNHNLEEVNNYYEVVQDKDKSQKIFHLIYANEGSEAGEIYNPYALNFIENSYQQITGLKSLDIIDSIKERFIIVSKDIIEKIENEEQLTFESFDNSDPLLIKLKKGKEIILKKCLIDELGFSNFKANGFEPTYNIFKNKENTKFIVRVELPGNCSIVSESERVGEYHIIKISGEKRKDKEPEKIEDNIFNMREYGKYSIEIPVKEDKDVKLTDDPPAVKKIEGVFILEYNIAKKIGIIEIGGEDKL